MRRWASRWTAQRAATRFRTTRFAPCLAAHVTHRQQARGPNPNSNPNPKPNPNPNPTRHELRCPEGCAFRLTPRGIGGWEQPGAPSPFVRSEVLPC